MTAAPALAHAGFWRLYWVTLRPYLFFVSGAAGAVGLALSDAAGVTFAAAFAAFFFSYGFGQAATDVFQIDTDSISSPYRPLTQGWCRGGKFFWPAWRACAFAARSWRLSIPRISSSVRWQPPG
jgi:4-hydroxybenzoate polyprenyltransferase